MRAQSLAVKQLALLVREDDTPTPEELERIARERPRVRGDCVDGPRPCPWCACRHHLFLDVTRVGSLQFPFPNLALEDLEETCSLDVADRGGTTLEDVGHLLGVSRERIRQLEAKVLTKLRRAGVLRHLS